MKELVEILKEKNKTISTMESCTGGAIANAITNIEGASQILKFSAVTYSNEFKIKMGVSEDVINKYTVYSINVAKEMSKKISDFTNSDYGIGVTGQINKIDTNNITNDDKTIYISIYDKNKDFYYTITIEAIDLPRSENKNLIINKIVEVLKKVV